ncbi:MAG: hypothetical protein P8Z33_13645, partial [Gammaproteobacteria bacterium]
VLLFRHQTRVLSVMSGLSGGDDPDTGWIDTSLDGPIKPLSFEPERQAHGGHQRTLKFPEHLDNAELGVLPRRLLTFCN